MGIVEHVQKILYVYSIYICGVVVKVYKMGPCSATCNVQGGRREEGGGRAEGGERGGGKGGEGEGSKEGSEGRVTLWELGKSEGADVCERVK